MQGKIRSLALAAVLCGTAPAALAYSGGITGYSQNPSANHGSGSNCSSCHSGGAFGGAAAIGGATSVSTNSTIAFTVDLTSSTAAAAGFNLSVTGGQVASGAGSQVVAIGAGITDELTHTSPKTVASNAASWSFNWTAPNTTGSQTMYVCINQVNLSGDFTGDGPIRCTTKSITVTNSAPTVSNVNNIATFTEGGAAVVVDSSISISEPDNDSLNLATVTISANYQSGADTLSCPGCAGAGLSSMFSAGTLTISGTASVATYASVLQGVTFSNSSQAPSSAARTIGISVRDTYNNTSNTGTTTLNVSAVNNAPTISAPATIGVTQDAPSPLTGISFADVDSGSGMLTASFGVAAGTLSSAACTGVTAGGTATALTLTGTITNLNSCISTSSLTYTTAPNSTATVTLGIGLNDNGNTGSGGALTAMPASVNLTVSPVNHAPTAVADTFNVGKNIGNNALDVLANDTDPDSGDTKSLVSVGVTDHGGTVTLGTGSPCAVNRLCYSPMLNYSGPETFSYTMQDSANVQSSASVTVTVSAGGSPVGVADSVSVPQNSAGTSIDVLANDTDPDAGDTREVSQVNGLSVFPVTTTHGSAALSAAGPNNQVVYTPSAGFAGSDSFTYTIRDAAGLTGSATVSITVFAPPDTDGDGMPDAFEDLYPGVLDKNNPADAAQDYDHDGLTNLQEYQQHKNPTVDDVAPVLTLPADLVVPATGYYTVVTLGTATARDGHDGPLTPTSSWTRPVVRPGRYDVLWSVTDFAGNTATGTQHVDVLPLANFSPDQVSGEGQTRTVTVTLNGDAPGCPAVAPSVTYTVTGTAGAADHDAVSGTLPISCASLTGTITVHVAGDSQAEPVETAVFTLTGASGAAIGTPATHVLSITDANAAPQVTLSTFQGAYPRLTAYQGDGTFTIAALAADPNGDALAYGWSGPDGAPDIDASASSFSFDPSALAPGSYTVSVLVADSRGGTATASLLLKVAAGTSTRVDLDADGVPDDVDTVLDYPAVLDNQTGDPATAQLLETDPGLTLRLGRTALAAGRGGALISMMDLVTYGVGAGGIALGADSLDNVGGIFDFEVHGLAPGGSARVVLPLQTALRSGAVYRKFMASSWHDFTSDANNSVASAASSFGQCPGPASTRYVSGLKPFADCVRLTLQDGGPDDADGLADGVIRDPGGAAVPPGSGPAPESAVDGGAFAPFSLFGLFGFAALRRVRRRHLQALLFALLLAAAVPAQAGTPLRYSGELSSGFDSNVSNAAASRDVRETGLVSGSASASSMRELNLYTTLELRGTALAEYSSSFSELSNGKISGLARVMYRPDGDFFTPLLAASFSAAYWQFGSAIRDSNEYRFGVFARRQITTQIAGRLSVDYAVRDSASRVFDTHGSSIGLNVDWLPVAGVTVYGGYQFYKGDVVSTATTPGDLDIILAAKVIEADDAFGGFGAGQLAYRLDARSHIGTLGLNYPFSRHWSADAQGRYIDTTANRGIGYRRTIGVLSLLARF